MSRARELSELASAYDSGGSLGFRNRIINGDMRIDQRNSGAATAGRTRIYQATNHSTTAQASIPLSAEL